MLKSLEKFLSTALDFLLPPRTDHALVKKMDGSDYADLPKAGPVEHCDWVHPLWQYKNKYVKAIIWEMKYRDNTLPLEHVGRALYEEIIAVVSDIVLFNADAKFILVPIPVSRERLVERGYNQSERIAKAVREYDTEHILLYAPQWFAKVRETGKQSRTESREERMKNLVGCFEADQSVGGYHVILIDDVVTTGSTLSETRKTLLEAGAREVWGFTVAH